MPEQLDQDLILYYYGEAPNAKKIQHRLATSPAEAESYRELCQLLEQVDALPVPEPHDDYAARVWRRLEPRLARQSPGQRFREWLATALTPRRLATAGALAALVVVAFTAGRFWPTSEGGLETPLPANGRERILMVAVGEHLERSKILLIELVNARDDGGTTELNTGLSAELDRAAELLPANRLYRQAALRSGQAGVADVLDDLERLLLDVAHSGELSPAGLEDLRNRIVSGDILFRVQVIGSNVARHGSTDQIPLPTPSPGLSGAV